MIPFLDLGAQYKGIKGEIDQAIAQVLSSSQFILGPAVEAFEAEFAKFCGSRHAMGVNSGTSALHLGLLALHVGPGDEVVTVAHTFAATVAAIRYTGARPVLVDVDARRFTMDPALLEAAITARTKAIVPVHLYGQCANMDPILQSAKTHGIPVLEDAAQAHGATYRGRIAGAMGDIGCFSFYPGKNLGAYGEAGGVVTENDEYARVIRAMRDWGQLQRGIHELPGYNYRMEGLQGAVLGVKLRHINAWTAARQRVARRYDDLLAPAASAGKLVLPAQCTDGMHVYHQYVIRVKSRDSFRNELQKLGIHTGVHYPLPIHFQPVFSDLGYQRGAFPEAERITSEIVSLPIYPELSDAQIEQVVAAVVRVIDSL